MFERFTDSARAVVVGAQQEARSLGHGWIGTEHLLLAVVADPATPLGRRLGDLGLSHDRVRAEVHATLGGNADDGSALRGLGIDLDAVRARVEEQFGPGALDQQPPAPARGLRSRLRRPRRPVPAGRRTAAVTSRSPAAPRRRSSSPCASRSACGQREIRLEHLTLGLMRADGLASTVVTRLGSSPAAGTPGSARRAGPGRLSDPSGSGAGSGTALTRHRQGVRQPTASITSSLTSKLAHTFCTSSESSRASISRKTFLAPSSSSGTLTEGRNDASAES